jgi:NAD(P)-dependent dehydrogenase (short-subunit alcohol dehydrogenase family)
VSRRNPCDLSSTAARLQVANWAAGIGAALAIRFARAGWQVLATCRDPTAAGELDALCAALEPATRARIAKSRLDLGDPASIAGAALALEGTPIDVLLLSGAATGGAAGEFGRTDYEAWDLYHRVNTQAPMRMAEAFVEHVAASRRRVIFAISSRVGPRPGFGYVGYRATKSALNQVIFQLALALAPRGIACAAAHPGYVATRATGQRGAITPAQSAEALFRIVDGLDLSQTGRFFDPDGSVLPLVTQQTEAKPYARG